MSQCPSQAMAPVARCVLQELLFEFLVLRPDTLNRWQWFLSAPGPRSEKTSLTSGQKTHDIDSAKNRISQHEPIEKRNGLLEASSLQKEPWNAVVPQFQPFVM